MKRFTERCGDGVRYKTRDYIITCYPKNKNLSAIDKMAVKLCELEDKLESGQLVELRCMVGDIIFVPYVYKGASGIMRLPVDEIQIAKYSIVYCTDFETDDETFAIKFSHGLFLSGTFGDIWFTDKAQAEARLKELQGR